ncbi:MAG TPA: TlpA disulfide reductase family protein [Bacteroidia bacterium]|nr:TlpA disulfide reductase family protein [Bacteroidia bacterium]
MKKLISHLISAFSITGIFVNITIAQGIQYTIKGTVKGNKTNKLYLHHKWNNDYITDSAIIKNNSFVIKGKTPEINMYWITLDRNPLSAPNVPFFIDQPNIIIKLHLDSLQFAQIKGGKEQDYFFNYRKMMENFGKKQQELYQQYNEAVQKQDGLKVTQIQQEFSELSQKVKNSLIEMIKSHPSSPVSGYIIYQEFNNNPNISVQELEQIVSYLDKKFLDTKFGKLAMQKLNQINGTAIGKKIMEFEQNDPDGKKINIRSFEGKYVLIDFWASWCGPCRMENPYVVAAYNKYKDKGFTVLGVSLDQNKNAWLKAIEKDGLTWTHVSDLKGWGNEVAQSFGISSIPQNILIDKQGIIIAKNLRGTALEEKLKEIFGE